MSSVSEFTSVLTGVGSSPDSGDIGVDPEAGAVAKFNGTVDSASMREGLGMLDSYRENGLITQEQYDQFTSDASILKQFDNLASSGSGRIDLQSDGDKALRAMVDGMNFEKAHAALARGLDVTSGPDGEQMVAMNYLAGGDEAAFLELAINWAVNNSDTVLRFNPVHNDFKFFDSAGQEVATPFFSWMADKLSGGISKDQSGIKGEDILQKDYFSGVRAERKARDWNDGRMTRTETYLTNKDEWVSVAPEYNRLLETSPVSHDQLAQMGGLLGIDQSMEGYYFDEPGKHYGLHESFRTLRDTPLDVRVKNLGPMDDRRTSESIVKKSKHDSGWNANWGKTKEEAVYRTFNVAANLDPTKTTGAHDQALRETLEFASPELLSGNTTVLLNTNGENVGNAFIGNVNIIDFQSQGSVYSPGAGDSVITSYDTKGANVVGGTGAFSLNAVKTVDLNIDDTDSRHDKENTVIYSQENLNTTQSVDDGTTNIVVSDQMDNWTLEGNTGVVEALVTGNAEISNSQITIGREEKDKEARYQPEDGSLRFSTEEGSNLNNVSITTGYLVDQIAIEGNITDSTIDTGRGSDVVEFAGKATNVQLHTQEGNDRVAFEGIAVNVDVDTAKGDDQVSLAGFFDGIRVNTGKHDDKVVLDGTFNQGADNRLDVGKGNDVVEFWENYRGKIDLSDAESAWRWSHKREVNEYDVAALQGEGWVKEDNNLVRRDDAGEEIARIHLSGDAKHIEKVAVIDSQGNEIQNLQDIEIRVKKKSPWLGYLGMALAIGGSAFTFGGSAALLAVGTAASTANSMMNGGGGMALVSGALGMTGAAGAAGMISSATVKNIEQSVRFIGGLKSASEGNIAGLATSVAGLNGVGGFVDPNLLNPILSATTQLATGGDIIDIAAAGVSAFDETGSGIPQHLAQAFNIAKAVQDGGLGGISTAVVGAALDIFGNDPNVAAAEPAVPEVDPGTVNDVVVQNPTA